MTDVAHLIIDVENGGFSIDVNPILEIGYAFCDHDWNVLKADAICILPPAGTVIRTVRNAPVPRGAMVIEKEAADINGYTAEGWDECGALSLEEARAQFLGAMAEFTGDICHGHNVSTEDRWTQRYFPEFHGRIREWRCSMKHLRAYCNFRGIEIVGTRVDPVTGVRIPGTLTLENGCKLAGHLHRGAHGAMEDCVGTAALMRHMMKQG